MFIVSLLEKDMKEERGNRFCEHLYVLKYLFILQFCGKLTFIYTRAQSIVEREMVHGSNLIKKSGIFPPSPVC